MLTICLQRKIVGLGAGEAFGSPADEEEADDKGQGQQCGGPEEAAEGGGGADGAAGGGDAGGVAAAFGSVMTRLSWCFVVVRNARRLLRPCSAARAVGLEGVRGRAGSHRVLQGGERRQIVVNGVVIGFRARTNVVSASVMSDGVASPSL